VSTKASVKPDDRHPEQHFSGLGCLPEIFQSPSTASTCTHFCMAMKISGFYPARGILKKGMDRLIEPTTTCRKPKV